MKKESEMIYGMHAIIEAIDAGKEIDKIIMKNDMQGRLSHDLFKAIEGRNIPIMRVPVERLDRITKKNHQGVIAFTIPVAINISKILSLPSMKMEKHHLL